VAPGIKFLKFYFGGNRPSEKLSLKKKVKKKIKILFNLKKISIFLSKVLSHNSQLYVTSFFEFQFQNFYFIGVIFSFFLKGMHFFNG
jgi:hypothetical protein